MPKTSIIILTCDNNKYIKKCIDSIYRYTNNFEIIVVDNASNPAYHGRGLIIRNEKNLGFPAGVNQGLKKATGEIIVLLNDDTIVTPCWLNHLIEHLKNYDIVGPVTNAISGPQMLHSTCDNLRNRLNEFSEQIHRQNAGKIQSWHRLVFYCVAMKREVLEKIGLLDEQFSPGNFEDDDFCLRAIEAGFRLGIAKDVFIYHYGSATFSKNNAKYQKLLETNKIKFDKKWPKKKYNQLVVKCAGGVKKTERKKAHDLALVMVVKNEAKGLERAILSVRNYVSEIVIAVDDSSGDKTLEIAKKYANVVKLYKWQDDFAHARNFAHAGVKAKWIIFLDGHEYIESMPDLSDILSQDKEAFLVTVKMENGVIFRALRLYKNGCQFDGAYHELVNCGKIGDLTKLTVVHGRIGGQDPQAAQERDEQRKKMIPEILGKQFKANHKNVRASFHLALHFMAIKDYKKALKYQSYYLKYAEKKGDRWFVYFNRAICHLSQGHLFRAYWAAFKADQETPDRWEISKLRGLIYYKRGWYQNSIENLIDSFKENTGDVSFKPWPRDYGATWNLVGECFYHQKKYFESGAAFKQAAIRTKDLTLKDLCEKRSKLMYKMAGAE